MESLMLGRPVRVGSLVAGVVGLLGSACSGEPLSVAYGALEVTVHSAGAGSDPDGFHVSVDGKNPRILTTEAATDFLLPAGPHTVALGGLSPNCTLAGDNSRTVVIPSSDTLFAQFEVSCLETGGLLEVLIGTTGTDIDPSGYVLTVDGDSLAAVEVNGSTTAALTTGRHLVELRQLTPNCSPLDPVRTVTLVAGGIARARFDVACVATAPAGRGHEIAFSSSTAEGTQILVMNDDGTAVRQFGPGQDPSWSPDGSMLAFIGTGSRVFVMSADGTDPRQVSPGDTTHFDKTPSWSPDGTRIAFVYGCCLEPAPGPGPAPPLPDRPSFALRVIPLDGSGVNTLPSRPSDRPSEAALSTQSWNPEGSDLIFSARPELVDDPLDLWLIGADGTTDRQLTFTPEDETDPAWSPDGTRIAFTIGNPSQGDCASHISIMNADGTGERTRLTTSCDDREPAWSPDGSQVAFTRDREGTAGIYVVNADGSGQTRLTNGLSAGHPTWRP
jgi:TolB protein